MTEGGEYLVVEEPSGVGSVAASVAAVAIAIVSCSKAPLKHDYDDVAEVEQEEEQEQVDEVAGTVEDDRQLEHVEEIAEQEEEEEDRVGYEIVALSSTVEQDQDTYSTSSCSSSSSSCSEPETQPVPEVMETVMEQGPPLKSLLKKTGDQKKGLRVSFLFAGKLDKDSWATNGTSDLEQDPPLLLTVREFQVPLDDYHDSPALVNITDSVEDIPEILTEENVKKHEILMEEVIQQKDEVVPVVPGTNGTSTRVDPPGGGIVLRSQRPKAPPPPPPPLPPPLVKVTPPVPVPGGKKIQVFQPSPKELSLSPPLKELTVNVPPVYGGDNWHIELSPLSSVPDSVSSDGSTVSSQDTIIMMTTEECRRNEEHMRQSELEYEMSLMEAERPAAKLPYPSSSSASSSSSSSSSSASSSSASSSGSSSGSSESVDSVKSKPVTRTNSQVRRILQRTAMKRSQTRAADAVRKPNNGSLADKLDEDDAGALEDAIRRLMTDDNDHQEQWNDQGHRKEQMRRSLIIGGSAPELNHGIASSQKNNSKDTTTTTRNVNESFLERSNGVHDAEEDLDELARFVEVGSERLARLRKRYSYTEDEDDGQGFGRRPSVRGIKPRFGSTHEILLQLQQSHQVHPLMANPGNTMTWPYGVSVSGIGGSAPGRSRRSGLMGPTLPKVYEDIQEDNAKKQANEGNYWRVSGVVRGAPEGSSGGQGQMKAQRPPPPPYGSDPRHLLYNRVLDINRNG